MLKKNFLALLVWITSFGLVSVQAQKSVDILAYIDQYKLIAMQEMQRTGVPASIKLAQGIHETMAGTSDLVQRSNNHFGIKCKTGWSGDKVYHDDDESGECFRAYSNAIESYQDHSNFLKNSARYQFLFALPATDYEGWAYGLKKAGYATNIKYSQILIKLIQTYDLQQYTLLAQRGQDTLDAVVATQPVAVLAKETIEHAVEVKETLYSIAKKYAVSVFEIMEWNQLKSTDLKVGQVLKIQQVVANGQNTGSR